MRALDAFADDKDKDYPDNTGISWLDEALKLAKRLVAQITEKEDKIISVDGRAVKCGDLENR